MRKWRTPEQLVEIGLSRSRVLMVNEAHDGLKRCIRTRTIGTRMIEPAHAAGVRHLALEALTPDFAAAANRDRRLGPGTGLLAQSDLRELMSAALQLGWSLIAYETPTPAHEYRLLSGMNDREEQQARNLAEIGEWHYMCRQTDQPHYATTSFLTPPGEGSTPRAS